MLSIVIGFLQSLNYSTFVFVETELLSQTRRLRMRMRAGQLLVIQCIVVLKHAAPASHLRWCVITVVLLECQKDKERDFKNHFHKWCPRFTVHLLVYVSCTRVGFCASSWRFDLQGCARA